MKRPMIIASSQEGSRHDRQSLRARGRRLLLKTVAVASGVALSMTMTLGAAGSAYADPYTSDAVAHTDGVVVNGTIPAGQLSVVNFHPVWGNKQANKESMLDYIDEASAAGVRMIVFPEMALTGYVSSSDPNSPAYRMAVSQAETTESPITLELASAADKYDMWVICVQFRVRGLPRWYGDGVPEDFAGRGQLGHTRFDPCDSADAMGIGRSEHLLRHVCDA